MKKPLVQRLGLVIAVVGFAAIVQLEHPAFADSSTPTPTGTLSETSVPSATETPTFLPTYAVGGTATPIPSATRVPTETISVESPVATATPPTRSLQADTPTRAAETETGTATREFTLTPEATATPEFTATPSPTREPTQTPSPTPYALSLSPDVLSIRALSARSYGRGTIRITRQLSDGQSYRQALIEYDSDGLRITGIMNIPHGLGPFPVVVLDHGYFKPSEYKTGDGTAPAANVFAANGYLTIAPDYRCYAGSQCGADPFYIGYAIDVLNLIAELPSLSFADTTRVGIWGHSMGGGITIRVITINHSIKVASLYGALSSDDEVHYCWLYGCTTPLVTPIPRTSNRLLELDPDYFKGLDSPSTDPSGSSSDMKSKLHEIFLQSSPSHFLSLITTPVIIHHGEADDIVPIQWSVDLADELTALGKTAVLYTYPGQGHVFSGSGWQLFMSRTLDFFNNYLNPHPGPITAEKRVLQQESTALARSY